MGLDKLYQLNWVYKSVSCKAAGYLFIHPIEPPKNHCRTTNIVVKFPPDEYLFHQYLLDHDPHSPN
jgi:hypothetical protein